MLDGMASQRDELREEPERYDDLRSGRVAQRTLHSRRPPRASPWRRDPWLAQMSKERTTANERRQDAGRTRSPTSAETGPLSTLTFTRVSNDASARGAFSPQGRSSPFGSFPTTTHKVDPTQRGPAIRRHATSTDALGKTYLGSISDEEALMFALCSTSKAGIAEALTDCTTGDVP